MYGLVVNLKTEELQIERWSLHEPYRTKLYNLNFSDDEKIKLESIFYRYKIDKILKDTTIANSVRVHNFLKTDIELYKNNSKLSTIHFSCFEKGNDIKVEKNNLFLYRKNLRKIIENNATYKRVIDSLNKVESIE